MTLDISYQGVFVVSEATPRLGGHLEIEVYLKAANRESIAPRFVGEGTIVRIGEKGQSRGFAAEVLLQAEGDADLISEYLGLIQ